MGRNHKADWSLEERLLSKRTVDPESECWIYTGSPSSPRYVQIGVRAFPEFGVQLIGVHRLAHLLWIGPVPEGHEVHHRTEIGCTSLRCFNPNHLKAVDVRTHRVDLSPSNIVYENARRTECVNGHPLSGGNLRVRMRNGRAKRECIACLREASKRHNNRQRKHA